MKFRIRSFNTYFAAALICFISGCATKTPEQRQQSTMRLFLEGPRADTSTGTVLVTRQRFPVNIERDPFLTEADLSSAMLVDDPSGDGTYEIQLAFNEHGTLLLDMITSANRGKHIIVYSQFPDSAKKKHKQKKKEESDDDLILSPLPQADAAPSGPRESAFLAAVLIRDRDTSGIFRFTPDASRKEALRIVRGLRNVIAAAKKKNNGF